MFHNLISGMENGMRVSNCWAWVWLSSREHGYMILYSWTWVSYLWSIIANEKKKGAAFANLEMVRWLYYTLFTSLSVRKFQDRCWESGRNFSSRTDSELHYSGGCNSWKNPCYQNQKNKNPQCVQDTRLIGQEGVYWGMGLVILGS